MAPSRVLVTGGAGYIGTHTCVRLLESGASVIVVDDLSNSAATAVERVVDLAPGDLTLHCFDLRDEAALDALLANDPVDAVIHLAGVKAVAESVQHPLHYFDVNLGGTIALLKVMERHGVRDLVFSSSATVYGNDGTLPLTESAPVSAGNPYGFTKLAIEQLLTEIAASDPTWRIIGLRYFNPVGAHESAVIGEDPAGIPNNLMPFIMQVAVGRQREVVIFGDDYPTPDGTCVRDFIHVVDLADGHLAALGNLHQITGFQAINLGTGRGHSVLDVLASARRAVGADIAYRIGPRRVGDAAETWADVALAKSLLGWSTTRSLDQMCADAWRWQLLNPQGYDPSAMNP